MKKYTLNLDEIDTLVEDVLADFKEGVVILRGDLAAGKTTFVKAVAKTFGYEEDVTSPTFSLQQCYGENLFHYDIYNHGLEHFLSLGMLEELDKKGLHFIEWGDDKLIKMLQNVGIEVMSIDIEKTNNDKREYIVCTY
jgi:tRNA threonylcarbamoyladenosine biosynthesis protein TsaE